MVRVGSLTKSHSWASNVSDDSADESDWTRTSPDWRLLAVTRKVNHNYMGRPMCITTSCP